MLGRISSHFKTGKSELSEVDRSFAGLAGEFPDRQRIEPAILEEMRFRTGEIQSACDDVRIGRANPESRRSLTGGAAVRFPAGDNQFDRFITQPFFQIHRFQHRLADNILMGDRQRGQQR